VRISYATSMEELRWPWTSCELAREKVQKKVCKRNASLLDNTIRSSINDVSIVTLIVTYL
jgi:hypothetical protein